MKKRVGAGDNDAIVIAAGEEFRVVRALRRIIERAKYCLIGVPEETRKANEDGTTSYLRPLPGAARMYPETDVPPVKITSELADVEIPELIDERAERYSKILPKDLAYAIADSPYYKLFEEFCKRMQPTIVARILHLIPASIKREGYNIEVLSERHFRLVLEMVASGDLAKEGAEEALKILCKNPKAGRDDIAKEIGRVEDLDGYISKLVDEKRELIIERGSAAFKPLMGVVMKEFRGKIDGKVIAEKLKTAIEKELKKLKT